MSDKHDHEYVQECKEWLARRKAWIDQKEKMFEDQYAMVPPRVNAKRLEDLEAWKFAVEVHEWELSRFIEDLEEQDEDPHPNLGDDR